MEVKMEYADTAYLLARYAARSKYDDLTDSAIKSAKFMLKDAISLMIGGSRGTISRKLAGLYFDWGGKPESTVLVYGRRLPAHNVGFLNSVLIHELDYDDTHDAGTMHVSPVAVPTCLAVGELTGASGKEVLSALVNTVELGVRLSLSIRKSISETGWIYSAICQYLSAAAVSAALLGLDEEHIVMAMGTAYAQMGGTYQVSADAADTKRMQPALAVRDGIWSAMLAKEGISGCHRVIDGGFGWINQYLRGEVEPERLRNIYEPIARYEIEDLSYKPYPSCRFTHSAIDAVKKMMQDHELLAEDVLNGRVEVSSPTFRSVCQPVELKQHPRTYMQAQYSIPFTLAVTLTRGEVTLETLSEETLGDAAVVSLAQRITPVISPELDRRYGRTVAPSIVMLNTRRGVFTECIEHPLGAPENPFTAEITAAKLDQCIKHSELNVDRNKLISAMQMIDEFENLDNINVFINTLQSAFKN